MAKTITQLEMFWMEVREEAQRFLALAQTGQLPEGQPTNGSSLFMTSVQNRDRGSNPSFVVEVERKLAAQRSIEGTHRLSTTDEIEAYHAEQVRRVAVKHDREVEKLVNTHEAGFVAAGRLADATQRAQERIAKAAQGLKPVRTDRFAEEPVEA